MIISSIILSTFSLQQIKPKLCINCKFFITDNNTNEFGKCSLFPKVQDNNSILVNGIKKNNVNEYFYASTLRSEDSLCGKEGKMHIRKYIRKSYK
jgi:hypothetical protein